MEIASRLKKRLIVLFKAHCKTRLATTSGDVLAAGNASDGKGVTIVGSTQVERVGCD
jgi:hypothetical protein